jgi:hypothetical protein
MVFKTMSPINSPYRIVKERLNGDYGRFATSPTGGRTTAVRVEPTVECSAQRAVERRKLARFATIAAGRLRSVTASLQARLELLTCMKRDDAPRRNESRFAGFRIPSGTL